MILQDPSLCLNSQTKKGNFQDSIFAFSLIKRRKKGFVGERAKVIFLASNVNSFSLRSFLVWWKSNFWENANFCIFLLLPPPLLDLNCCLTGATLTGSFACFVFSHIHTHTLAPLLDWVIMNLTINWGRDDDQCVDSCQNIKLASVDSSELKIVRITDRQFTHCDIYLHLPTCDETTN